MNVFSIILIEVKQRVRFKRKKKKEWTWISLYSQVQKYRTNSMLEISGKK